jgi:hypothetical protein
MPLRGMSRRVHVIKEFLRMVLDRRDYVLIPVLLAVIIILVLMLAGEMPVLIPFFYAVF